jgi:hypothetical protein
LVVGSDNYNRLYVVFHKEGVGYGEYCLDSSWYTTVVGPVADWKKSDLARSDYLLLCHLVKNFFKHMELCDKTLRLCCPGTYVKLPNGQIGVLAFPGKEVLNVFGLFPVGRHYEIKLDELELASGSMFSVLDENQTMTLDLLQGYIQNKYLRQSRCRSDIIFQVGQVPPLIKEKQKVATTSVAVRSKRRDDKSESDNMKRAKSAVEATTSKMLPLDKEDK